jgi:eukaryotic-like serine/threonine-protein kinase
MPYCHECGAEVAKTDMYCSICGIAMEFLPESDSAENDSQEHEIPVSSESLESKPVIDAVSDEVPTPSIISSGESSDSNEPQDPSHFSSADSIAAKNAEKAKLEEEIDIDDLFESNIIEAKLDSTEDVATSMPAQTGEFIVEAKPTGAVSENFEATIPYNVIDLEMLNLKDVDNENAEDVNEDVDLASLVEAEDLERSEVVSVEEESLETGETEESINIPFDETEGKIIEKTHEDTKVAEVEDTIETSLHDLEIEETQNEIVAIEDSEIEKSIETNELEIAVEEEPQVAAEDTESEETEVASDDSTTEDATDEEVASDEPENTTEVVVGETVENVEAAEEAEVVEEVVPEAVEEISEPIEETIEPELVPGEVIEETPEDSKPEEPAAVESSPESGIEIAAAAVIVGAAVAVPLVVNESESEKLSRPYTSQVGESVDTGGGKSKQLKPLEEGTLLNNRYEVVRKIGGGGMGAVYLASDRNLGGVLRAVKEMVQAHIEEEQQHKAIEDFRRESLLLTSLEHPSIPTIYDYFLDDREGRFYLVMKYISGGDLAGRMRSNPEGRIDEKSVLEWSIQVADVLDYLHNRVPAIVYRDLKPSNIMIDGNSGRVMLIDFGIARWVNIEEKGVTAVGTMGYAPPELFSGNVEPRSDIYSLGSTMFHMLTGADPQNSPLLIFDFNKNPRPRQINPNLSDQMEQILMKAVEYDTDKRFASAGQMRDAMAQHLENLKNGKLTYGVNDGIAAVVMNPNQSVFCGFCGQKIVSSDMFCPFCGAKQPMAQQGSGSISQSNFSSPSISARLLLLGTNELDTPSYNLDKDSNLIGRRDPMSNIFPEVDLSKYDPQTKISRRHARLWREGDMFMVEDLGSSNGTSLNTSFNELIRLLPHQPRVIAHGDKIKIGDTTLHFLVG